MYVHMDVHKSNLNRMGPIDSCTRAPTQLQALLKRSPSSPSPTAILWCRNGGNVRSY